MRSSTDTSENLRNGKIELILGPMFSGKTTELMRRIKRYEISQHKCLVIKYANDNRYEKNAIATHDAQKLNAVCAHKLEEVNYIDDYNVIGIDEGQFFPDTVDFAEKMANNGKIVIVAALDGTFQRVEFPDFLRLIPLSESIVKLTAVCMVCFKDAAFTKRKSSDTAIEVIGGSDIYLATCRNCYFKVSPKRRAMEPLKENIQKISPKKRLKFSE